jgi:hypothetical protein
MLVGQILVGQILVGQILVGQILVGQMVVGQMYWDNKLSSFFIQQLEISHLRGALFVHEKLGSRAPPALCQIRDSTKGIPEPGEFLSKAASELLEQECHLAFFLFSLSDQK